MGGGGMEGSHFCHQRFCIVHLVFDPSHINGDREECRHYAWTLRRNDQPVPMYCDIITHDPPAFFKMQHLHLSTNLSPSTATSSPTILPAFYNMQLSHLLKPHAFSSIPTTIERPTNQAISTAAKSSSLYRRSLMIRHRYRISNSSTKPTTFSAVKF